MKTCSKCKKDQPRTNFVKSERYIDGLYSMCKDCRKENRIRGLKLHPMCSRCKTKPHTSNHAQCYDCQREARSQSSVPKFRRDSFNKTMCSKCRTNPKSKKHAYCVECRRKSVNEWIKKQGGMWNYLIRNGQKNRALAVAAVGRALRRGKIKKAPCEVCGFTKVEAHHYMGYEREYWLVFKWLCKPCHDHAHKILRSQLTEQPLLL